jgi:hypothetical protein
MPISKGSIGNYINTRNSWTETNGMLMGLELPGIYTNRQEKILYFRSCRSKTCQAGRYGYDVVDKKPDTV